MTTLVKADSKENQTLITSNKINHPEVEIYRNNNDKENVFAALQSGYTRYEIAQIGYSFLQGANDFTLDNAEALAKSLIKITGVCGANCPITNYIDMDNSIPVLIHIEAHTVEADVDHDGIKEIIATVGTAAQTSLYKLQNEKMVTANLNEIMNAAMVLYNPETNTFQAVVTKGTLSTWMITNNQLQLVS